MDNGIYYLLGILAIVYLVISAFNKRNAKRRKSRKFMDGYERKGRKKEE